MRSPHRVHALTLLAGVLWATGPGTALAEKADRSQPIVVEADKRGTVDTQKQFTVFTGNVVITQGTLQVRADRVEIQEAQDKFRTAVAFGSAQRPAFFKQKREGTEETVEGTAERIDFDEKSDTLRLTGNPVVRRMLDAKMIDEVTGTLITWDNRTEFFTVDGGTPTLASPSGRVRMFLSPRQGASAPAASAPAPPRNSKTGAAGK
ncbi:MAG: lipopolysaccharide transport periplasmic protein LptA [Betaproteobacteria bacterium]